MGGTRFSWNSARTNYFTQTWVSGRYVSACGTLYAERETRGRYRVWVRNGPTVGWSASFAGLGAYLDTVIPLLPIDPEIAAIIRSNPADD